METNYDRLQYHKKEVLAEAVAVAKKDPVSLSDAEIDIKLSKTKTDIAESKGNEMNALGKAIDSLNEIKDNRIGITWTKTEDLGRGNKALIRDGRNVNTDPEILRQERPEKYAMQVLNQVRSAIMLMDAENVSQDTKNSATEKLMFVANKALNNIDGDEKLGPGIVKNYTAYIIDTVEKAGVSGDVREKLSFTTQMANYQDEHKHIVTLSSAKNEKGQKHTIIEADIILAGITPAIRDEFNAILDQKNPSSKTNIGWYDNLPEYKKNMIRDVSDKIVAGKHVLPTQLLGTMPGLRNAYDKITAVQTDDQEKGFVIVNENFHSGTPASRASGADKQGRQAIANMNIEQAKSFTPDSKIKLNVLNSGILGLEHVNGGYILKQVNEGYILKQMKESSKDLENVQYAASPMNDWRKVPGGGRNHSEFKNTINEIGKVIENQEGLKNTSKVLQRGDGLTGIDSKKAFNEIDALKKKDPEYATVLKSAINARLLIDTPVIQEKGNINLAVTNEMSYLETHLKKETTSAPLQELQGKVQTNERIDFCKSGKDRTGYVQTKNTHHAVNEYLGIANDNVLLKGENLLRQVAAGHTQEMTGIQGGTIGCHGIKHSAVFVHTKEDSTIDRIHNQESANYNILRSVDKKQAPKIVAKFEKDFQAAKAMEGASKQSQLDTSDTKKEERQTSQKQTAETVQLNEPTQKTRSALNQLGHSIEKNSLQSAAMMTYPDVAVARSGYAVGKAHVKNSSNIGANRQDKNSSTQQGANSKITLKKLAMAAARNIGSKLRKHISSANRSITKYSSSKDRGDKQNGR